MAAQQGASVPAGATQRPQGQQGGPQGGQQRPSNMAQRTTASVTAPLTQEAHCEGLPENSFQQSGSMWIDFSRVAAWNIKHLDLVEDGINAHVEIWLMSSQFPEPVLNLKAENAIAFLDWVRPECCYDSNGYLSPAKYTKYREELIAKTRAVPDFQHPNVTS